MGTVDDSGRLAAGRGDPGPAQERAQPRGDRPPTESTGGTDGVERPDDAGRAPGAERERGAERVPGAERRGRPGHAAHGDPAPTGGIARFETGSP